MEQVSRRNRKDVERKRTGNREIPRITFDLDLDFLDKIKKKNEPPKTEIIRVLEDKNANEKENLKKTQNQSDKNSSQKEKKKEKEKNLIEKKKTDFEVPTIDFDFVLPDYLMKKELREQRGREQNGNQGNKNTKKSEKKNKKINKKIKEEKVKEVPVKKDIDNVDVYFQELSFIFTKTYKLNDDDKNKLVCISEEDQLILEELFRKNKN